MKGLLQEIQEIPQRAQDCLLANQGLILPLDVPYLGMGSSYFAPLTLYYCGKSIVPEIASEYYYYLSDQQQKLGVLLSQSGESSETVWNLEKFEEAVVITNTFDSSLGCAANTRKVAEIRAGPEQYSSTKSYINTLIVLYLGLGIDPTLAVQALSDNFESLAAQAESSARQIASYVKSRRQVKGFYIIGSGPNAGTAYQAALTLSETTKLSWIGMPVAQYDHGPKETAEDTVVIILNAGGKDVKRIQALKLALQSSNALIVEVSQSELPENLSPIMLIAELNWIMNYLADELEVGDTFLLGGKVTKVDELAK